MDTQISLVGDRFESCAFRKSLNTDALLNFSAICPFSWKTGVILDALTRAKVICSNSELVFKWSVLIEKYFLRNGYSAAFFDIVVTSFQQRKYAGTGQV